MGGQSPQASATRHCDHKVDLTAGNTITAMAGTSTGDRPAGDDEAVPEVGRYYDLALEYLERDKLDAPRRYLARDPGDAVLDLGGATGPMLPYFEAEKDGDLAVHVVDPNEHYRAWAAQKADEYDLELTVEAGRAESIPCDDDAFDTVVTSQVFCTVEDVEAGIAELKRVLRPDGKFRFLEHVHSGGIEGTVESALTPLWKRIADGCHLDRHTGERFQASELKTVDTQWFSVGLFPPRSYVLGTAVLPE